MEHKATTIVLANQKGGCGKTTTSLSLAAGFIARGFSTCLVDLDPQCNVTSTFGIDLDDLLRQDQPTILDAYMRRTPAREIVQSVSDEQGVHFGILPGHRALDQVPAKLEAEILMRTAHDDQSPFHTDDDRAEHRLRFKKSLESLSESFDFIVIDTPPALGFLLTSALIAADKYVIPVFASFFDLDGLGKLTTTVRKVRERANADLELLGVVLGNFDASTKLDSQIYEKLKQRFPEQMCSTTIARSVKHREATVHRTTIYEHAPDSPAAQQFLALTDELLARLGHGQGASSEPNKAPSHGEDTPPLADAVREA